MDGERPYFRSEIQEASHRLGQLMELKAQRMQDVTDLTYAQVRLLAESVGEIRQLRGQYVSYSFLGSPVVYGVQERDGVPASHDLPPDRYLIHEVLAEHSQAVLVVLEPMPNLTAVVYTAAADSLREALDSQITDPQGMAHPRRPIDGGPPGSWE